MNSSPGSDQSKPKTAFAPMRGRINPEIAARLPALPEKSANDGEPPGNETAGKTNPGVRAKNSEKKPDGSNTRQDPTGKLNQGWEDRRNAAACHKNRYKREPWQADFIGVMTVEGLPDGARVWVNIQARTNHKGETFFSVVLRKKE
jgi:hypothetical protein